MKMSGEKFLEAPREEVWRALNDTDVLRRCIPGCQDLERIGDNELKAIVAVKVGPVNAKFNGDVTLSEINPPESYTISGSGKGGAAGFASGSADVALSESDGGTLLNYDVAAKVGGKIAQVGSRLIDATAAKLAEEFFTNLSGEFAVGELAGGEAPAETPGYAAGEAGGAPPEGAAQNKPIQIGTPLGWMWLVLAALIILVMITWLI